MGVIVRSQANEDMFAVNEVTGQFTSFYVYLVGSLTAAQFSLQFAFLVGVVV